MFWKLEAEHILEMCLELSEVWIPVVAFEIQSSQIIFLLSRTSFAVKRLWRVTLPRRHRRKVSEIVDSPLAGVRWVDRRSSKLVVLAVHSALVGVVWSTPAATSKRNHSRLYNRTSAYFGLLRLALDFLSKFAAAEYLSSGCLWFVKAYVPIVLLS